MQPPDLQAEVARLSTCCGRLKVWSLVVTILGDLCQQRDDAVSGRVLDLILGRIGITNQALRVALHRLRRDGWIESRKDGRSSHYLLSVQGWEMARSAKPIIYAPAGPEPADVALILAPAQLTTTDFAEMLPDDAVFLTPRSAIAVAPQMDLPEDLLQTPFKPDIIPRWTRDLIIDPDLAAEYDNLASAVAEMLAGPLPDAPVDSTVLRVLVLHHWRRLRLRHGPLPDLLLPPDWPGAGARSQVMQTLQRLPRPSLDTLWRAYESEMAAT